MYQCYICNSEFDEPGTWHYTEDMNSEGAMQDFYVSICPICGSEEINEFKREEE